MPIIFPTPMLGQQTEDLSILQDHVRDAIPTFDKEELYNPTMVGVNVQDEKYFIIQREIISKYSPYFRSAFAEGKFAEGVQKTIKLLDVRPETFACFVDFMFTQLITSSNSSYGSLIEAWIFADKYDCPRLRQAILETFQIMLLMGNSKVESEHDTFPSPEEMHLLYENTVSSASLRRLLVDWYIAATLRSEAEENTNHATHPHDFLAETLTRSRRMTDALFCPRCGPLKPSDGSGECDDVGHDAQDSRIGPWSSWCTFHEHQSTDERDLCQWRRRAMVLDSAMLFGTQ